MNLAMKRICLGLSVISSCTIAQSLGAQENGVRVGESMVFPEITFTYFDESNVFRSSENELSATGLRIAPKATLRSDIGTLVFEAGYSGEYSLSDVDETDYDDHTLRLESSAEFSRRSQGSVGFSFTRRADKPGTGLALTPDGTLPELPVRNFTTFGAEHIYGARNARGNLITGLRLADVNYSSSGAATNRSDYTEIEPYVTLSLRISGTTRGIIELSHSAQNYNDADDRDQTNLFFGLDWPESDLFGGTAKIGVLDFDVGNESGTDVGVEVGLYYNPSSISNFNLTVERNLYDLNDSIDAGSNSSGVTISDEANLTWDYQWSGRVSHEAEIDLDIKERDCSSESQVTTTFGLQFFFSVRQWLSLGAGLETSDRRFDGCDTGTTPQSNFDFSNQLVKASVRMRL